MILQGRRMTFSSFLVVVAVLLQIRHTVAQQRGAAPSNSQQKSPVGQGKYPAQSPPPSYSSYELVLTSDKLPAQFMGNDIGVLYERLRERDGQQTKSEFETTEQWQRRVASIGSKPLIGNLTTDSTWAFHLSLLASSYDADKQLLHAYIPLEEVGDEMGPGDMMRVAESSEDCFSTNYVGTNAFGARVPVKKTNCLTHYVAVTNWTDFKLVMDETDQFGLKNNVHETIASPLDQAPRMKANLAAVAIVKLKAPFVIDTKTTFTKATIQLPLESADSFNFVVGKIQEIWIYDQASGRVHSKIRPDK